MKLPEELKLHPALAVWNPIELEKVGDSSRSLFDRWFCYKQALQHCANIESPEAKRIAKKLSHVELDRDFNVWAFGNIVKEYTEIIEYCTQSIEQNNFDLERIATYIRHMENCGRTLRSYRQQFSFISATKNYLQKVYYDLLNKKPGLRRKNQHLLLNLKGFISKQLRLRTEKNSTEYHLFVKEKLTIGSSHQPGREGDIFVQNQTETNQESYVSPFHATLEYHPEGCEISRGDTEHHVWIQRADENILVTHPTLIQNEDKLMLGKLGTSDFVSLHCKIFYDETENISNSIGLNVDKGIPTNYNYIIFFDKCGLGRSEANPIQIEDRWISRTHAVFTHDKGGFWIADVGSRNGTFVNSEPCSEPTPLLVGDKIQFGKYIKMMVI